VADGNEVGRGARAAGHRHRRPDHPRPAHPAGAEAAFEFKDGTKNGDKRDVKISAELAGRLRAAGNGDALIFTTRNGRPPLRSAMADQWKRTLRQAGLPPSRRHDLRHAHASLIANDPNVPLAMVRDRLGHRDLATTNGYLHPDIDAQDAAVAAVEAAMRGAASPAGGGTSTAA
jgi:integrase